MKKTLVLLALVTLPVASALYLGCGGETPNPTVPTTAASGMPSAAPSGAPSALPATPAAPAK